MKSLAATFLMLAAATAGAAQITLLATMGNKAIVTVDGKRQTLSTGQSVGDAKLVSVTADGAVFSINGQQRRVALGEGYVAQGQADSGGGSVILSPDPNGHYFTKITINGASIAGVVDTGATHLSLNATMAQRARIDLKEGSPVKLRTANGTINGWLITIPEIKLGTFTVYGVPAIVSSVNDDTPALLGTSLINRFQMKREQDLMILTKKAY
ncbi:retropepsin-like aspartic protease family protein [Chitinibacteraceae bacterium HSL-7]